MTINVQISIKDEQSAKQWRNTVEDINTDYKKALADAAETMVNMKDFADGTMVDEFVKYGDQLLNAAQVTFEAINTIASTVDTVVDKVNNFVSEAVGGIGKLVGKILK